MPIHNELLPHLNKSSHGYAFNLNDRLEKGLITREKAIAELNTREDRKQVIEILKGLKKCTK